jgi:MFS family permease
MIASLSGAIAALRQVLANPDMRRAAVAWMLAWAAEWAWLVALLVFAYVSSGVAAVGLVGLARTLPAGILAPALASLTDRLPRQRVLLAAYGGRAIVVGCVTAAVLLGADPLVIYALAPIDALLGVLMRPSHMALLPSLARAPEELVAGNVASSLMESIGILSGPAIGGVLVASLPAPWGFGVPVAAFAVAAVSVSAIHPPPVLVEVARAHTGVISTVLGGVRALTSYPHAALVVGLMSTQTLVRGLLSVLLVVAAVDLMAMGEQGVGFLNSAIGAGALLGALVAVALVGRTRLAIPFAAGLTLWGLPILLIGLLPVPAAAVAFLAVLGIGNAVLDVSGFTLLQRTVPNAVQGRVFGMLESLVALTVGIGSALAPVVVSLLGVRGALMVTGVVLPILAAASWRTMRGEERWSVVPERELRLLRGVPMLASLPLTVLEQLAGGLRPVRFADGIPIIRQGEVGDRFYIVAEGEAEVRSEGKPLRRLGPGDSFGEIALLRDVPRTVDVLALGEVLAYALDRPLFVQAVTGDRRSMDAAEAVISARLGAG